MPRFLTNSSGKNLIWPVSVHCLWCYHGNQLLTGSFFSQNRKPLLNEEKFKFFSLCNFILAHISVPLFILITFGSISAISWIFRNSKMADPRCPPFCNHDVITTSYKAITFHCRPQRNFFGRTVSPPSLIVIASIFSKLWRERGRIPSPNTQKTKKCQSR